MIKIGLTLETLITMPFEGNIGINWKDIRKIDEKTTFQGQTNITITGQNRRVFEAVFEYLSKSDYEKIIQFDFLPQSLFVKIMNTEEILLFDGLGFINVEDKSLDSDSNLYYCKIIISEIII